MNSTFKVVFNKARGALMVVNEVTSSVQAKGTKTVVATAVAAMIAGVAGTAAAAGTAYTDVTGITVGGTVTITGNADANKVDWKDAVTITAGKKGEATVDAEHPAELVEGDTLAIKEGEGVYKLDGGKIVVTAQPAVADNEATSDVDETVAAASVEETIAGITGNGTLSIVSTGVKTGDAQTATVNFAGDKLGVSGDNLTIAFDHIAAAEETKVGQTTFTSDEDGGLTLGAKEKTETLWDGSKKTIPAGVVTLDVKAGADAVVSATKGNVTLDNVVFANKATLTISANDGNDGTATGKVVFNSDYVQSAENNGKLIVVSETMNEVNAIIKGDMIVLGGNSDVTGSTIWMEQGAKVGLDGTIDAGKLIVKGNTLNTVGNPTDDVTKPVEASNAVVADEAEFDNATVTIGANRNVDVKGTLTLTGDNTIAGGTDPVTEDDVTVENLGVLTAGELAVNENNVTLNVGENNVVNAGALAITSALAGEGGTPAKVDASLELTGTGKVNIDNEVTIAGIHNPTGENASQTLKVNGVEFTAISLTVGQHGIVDLTSGSIETEGAVTVQKGAELKTAEGKTLTVGGALVLEAGSDVDSLLGNTTAGTLSNASKATFANLTLKNGGTNAAVIEGEGEDATLVRNLVVTDKLSVEGGTFTNEGIASIKDLSLSGATFESIVKGGEGEFEGSYADITGEISLAKGAVFKFGELQMIKEAQDAILNGEGEVETPAVPAKMGLVLNNDWTISDAGSAIAVEGVELNTVDVVLAKDKGLTVTNGATFDVASLTLTEGTGTGASTDFEVGAKSEVTIGQIDASADNTTVTVGGELNVSKLFTNATSNVTVEENGVLDLGTEFALSKDGTFSIGYVEDEEYTGPTFNGLEQNDGKVYVEIEADKTIGANDLKLSENVETEATEDSIASNPVLKVDSVLDTIQNMFVNGGSGLVFVEGIAITDDRTAEQGAGSITYTAQKGIQNIVIAGLDSFNVTDVDGEIQGSVGSISLAEDETNAVAGGALQFKGNGNLIQTSDKKLTGINMAGNDLYFDINKAEEGDAGSATIGSIIGAEDVIVNAGNVTVDGKLEGNKDGGDDIVGGSIDVADGSLTVTGDVTIANNVNVDGKLEVKGDTTANAIVAAGEVTLGNAELVAGIELSEGAKLTAGDVTLAGNWSLVTYDENGEVVGEPIPVSNADYADTLTTLGERQKLVRNKGVIVAEGATIELGSVDSDDAIISVTGGSLTVTGDTFVGGLGAADAIVDVQEVLADNVRIEGGELKGGDIMATGTISLKDVNAEAEGAAEVASLTADKAVVINGGKITAGTIETADLTVINTVDAVATDVIVESGLVANAKLDVTNLTIGGVLNVGQNDEEHNYQGVLKVGTLNGGVIYADPALGEGLDLADASLVEVAEVAGGVVHAGTGSIATVGGTIEQLGAALAKSDLGLTQLTSDGYNSVLFVAPTENGIDGIVVATGEEKNGAFADYGNSNGLFAGSSSLVVLDAETFGEGKLFADEAEVKVLGDLYIANAKAGQELVLADDLSDKSFINEDGIKLDYQRILGAELADNKLVVDVKDDLNELNDAKTIETVKSFFANGAEGTSSSAVFHQVMFGNANAAMSDKDLAQALDDVAGIGATAGMASVTMDALSAFNDTVAQRTSILAPNAEGTTVWADVNGGRYEAKRLFNGAGYSSDIYAGVLGVDTVVACGAKIGAALTVGTGDTDSKNTTAETSMDSDFFGVSIYTSKTFGDVANVAVDLGYMQGSNDVSVKSYGLNKFSADSDALTLGIRGELLAQVGSFNLVPHAGLRWTKVSVDSFEAGYKTDIDDMNVFQLPVGITVSGSFEGAGFTWAPAFDLSFVPAFGDKDADMTLGIAGASKTSAYGVQVIDSNPVQATIGIDATNGAWAFGLNYKLGAGSDGRMNNAFNANVRYTF